MWWRLTALNMKNNLRIFNWNVKSVSQSVLIYRSGRDLTSESLTKATFNKLLTFINNSLSRIVGWLNSLNEVVNISAEQLGSLETNQRIPHEVFRRKWGWVVCILTNPSSDVTSHTVVRFELEWETVSSSSYGFIREMEACRQSLSVI